MPISEVYNIDCMEYMKDIPNAFYDLAIIDPPCGIGEEWMKKYFSWISVKERLPEEGQRILVGFLFYYKYYDREAESRRDVDIFTYKNGVWVRDNGESYPGKELTRRDIKVICWQPIPSFDEILEANRDVLERIKEKGD